MDFAWSPEDVAFKEELEAFLDKEMPPFIEQWADNEDADAALFRSMGLPVPAPCPT